jgi:hypothetical protein
MSHLIGRALIETKSERGCGAEQVAGSMNAESAAREDCIVMP